MARIDDLPGDKSTLIADPKARWAMAHSRTAPIRAKHKCGTWGERTYQDHFRRRFCGVIGIVFKFWCPLCRKTFTRALSYGLSD